MNLNQERSHVQNLSSLWDKQWTHYVSKCKYPGQITSFAGEGEIGHWIGQSHAAFINIDKRGTETDTHDHLQHDNLPCGPSAPLWRGWSLYSCSIWSIGPTAMKKLENLQLCVCVYLDVYAHCVYTHMYVRRIVGRMDLVVEIQFTGYPTSCGIWRTCMRLIGCISTFQGWNTKIPFTWHAQFWGRTSLSLSILLHFTIMENGSRASTTRVCHARWHILGTC